MSTTPHISVQDLHALIDDLRAAGVLVTGPAKTADGGADYLDLERGSDLALLGPLPRSPLKALFLPPTEPLFSYRRKREGFELTNPPAPSPRVVIGARPCDAAAIEVLDKVMGWDYRDDHWFARRAATTIVSLACAGEDECCFCEAVGLGRASKRGADLLLCPAAGGFAIEVVSDKGRALITDHARRFSMTGDEAAPPTEASTQMPKVDRDALAQHLADRFVDDTWVDLALRCHGCGACAASCPTCHCFDIVDEPEGRHSGVRRRNWDTCQTGLFTRHASGHNPRADQTARMRQRLLHKFSIYPRKFGEILCTGCGRCMRACPGGLDLIETLGRFNADAQAAPVGGGQ